jgi:hypothetical protein
VTIQNFPLPPSRATLLSAPEAPAEADPWASYQDELDLQNPPAAASAPPVNDFSAAAARLLQRQKSMTEAAKKAQEEAKGKSSKSE